MDRNTRDEKDLRSKPPQAGPALALNVLALCFTLSVLGRGLGESFTVFLKPISESFGWDRAQVVSVYSLTALARRPRRPADRPPVRPLRTPQRSIRSACCCSAAHS